MSLIREYLKAKSAPRPDGIKLETADQHHADYVLQHMRRDLEAANDKIRVLQGEKRMTDHLSELYEEVKKERDTLRKEALSAAAEAETLRKMQADLQEKLRLANQEKEGQAKIARSLFEAREGKEEAERRAREKEEQWKREKALLVQELDQAKEVRDTVAQAYERGKRTVEDELMKVRGQLAHEREAMQRDLAMKGDEVAGLKDEVAKLQSRLSLVAELEQTTLDLRNTRNQERDQHRMVHDRLREELLQAQRDCDDWRVAFETSERHKVAMAFDLQEVKREKEVLLQEKASLLARLNFAEMAAKGPTASSIF